MYFPTWDWIAICQKCNQAFNLGDAPIGVIQTLPYTEYVLTFPKGDASEVRTVCPSCGEEQVFPNSKLLRPQHIIDSEVKSRGLVERLSELNKEIEELKTEKTKLEGQLNESYETMKQKDADISKFAEAFFQLGRKLSKESISEQATDSQKKQPEKKATYEGTNV